MLDPWSKLKYVDSVFVSLRAARKRCRVRSSWQQYRAPYGSQQCSCVTVDPRKATSNACDGGRSATLRTGADFS